MASMLGGASIRKSMDPVFGHVFIDERGLPLEVSRAHGIKLPDCAASVG